MNWLNGCLTRTAVFIGSETGRNMKLTESRTRTITDEVTVGVACDHCKKQILSAEGRKTYYHVTTHHNDWGNDSSESYEYFDFCSYKCLQKHQEEYFREATGSEEYEIKRTKV